MKKTIEFATNEKTEIGGFLLSKVISKNNVTHKKRKNINFSLLLNNKFLFLNLIIIYFIILLLNKKYTRKFDDIKSNYYKNNFSNIIHYFPNKELGSFIDKYRRTSIIWPLPKEIIFKPLMTKNEIIALSYFMKQENIYFEFGSGGSTNLASYYKVKTYSVESDAIYHQKLKKSGIRANYITIDLKVNGLGYPGEETKVDDWKKYIQAYKSEYNANIILIDGRFRVACALDIFQKIKNETIILIHDYGRKEYHILENFYIKVKTWDSLVLFIKNPIIDSIPENLYNFYLKEKLI